MALQYYTFFLYSYQVIMKFYIFYKENNVMVYQYRICINI